MEIEAKFVLGSQEDYERAVQLFTASGAEDSVLENHFFDGPGKQLQQAGVMLRLRIKSNSSAELTIKTHTEVEQGSACRFLDANTAIPVDVARQAIDNANTLTPYLEAVFQKYSISSLKYLGGFRTHRKTCKTTFSGDLVTLKLDEVLFQFGTHYELEISCGDSPAHDLLDEVQKVLVSNNIKGVRGTRNKFETFIRGCAEAMMSTTSSFAP